MHSFIHLYSHRRPPIHSYSYQKSPRPARTRPPRFYRKQRQPGLLQHHPVAERSVGIPEESVEEVKL